MERKQTIKGSNMAGLSCRLHNKLGEVGNVWERFGAGACRTFRVQINYGYEFIPPCVLLTNTKVHGGRLI